MIDRTLSYIGGVVVGRESADQLGGPIRIAQVSGQVATAGFVALHASGRGAVGLDRAAESVSDPAARWRSPFVLCDRGGARPAAVGAGAGIGFRIGLAIVVMLMIFATFNDILHLASVTIREPWPSGNVSESEKTNWGGQFRFAGG